MLISHQVGGAFAWRCAELCSVRSSSSPAGELQGVLFAHDDFLNPGPAIRPGHPLSERFKSQADCVRGAGFDSHRNLEIRVELEDANNTARDPRQMMAIQARAAARARRAWIRAR